MPARMLLRIVSGVMPCSAVVFFLQGAAAVGFFDRPLHRVGHLVGIQNHLGVDVAGGPADGLHQRRFAAQKAFLVGVEDRHQRDLGQVEPFAQQIHADQRIEMPGAQIAQQLDALEGVQLAVQPFAAHALLAEIERQIFGQPLGERGDQHPLADGGPLADLLRADAAPGRGPG